MHTERDAQERAQAFLARHVHELILGILPDIQHGHGLPTVHHFPHQALLDGQRRPLGIRLTGAMRGAQTQGVAGLIYEHQGAHFGAHKPGGLAYDALQDLIQVEAGTDVLPNVNEGG